MELKKHVTEVKKLIGDQVCMGTYGLVELELDKMVKKAKKKPKAKFNYWELDLMFDKIIDGNVQDIPFEGKEINKSSIKEELFELIVKLAPEYEFKR